ncbi:MAG TPA: hypothetical protein VH796_18250 [Nitrososphaeraceae archaeon]|jgi:hypothetical protein
MECLTEKCSDCTGFYVNKAFNHRLQCMHECHKINEKVLEQVGHPESNANLRAPHSLNSTNKDYDTDHILAEDENKHLDRASKTGHKA